MKHWTRDRALILDTQHAVFFEAACRAFNPLLDESEKVEALAYAEQAWRAMSFAESKGEFVYVEREK